MQDYMADAKVRGLGEGNEPAVTTVVGQGGGKGGGKQWRCRGRRPSDVVGKSTQANNKARTNLYTAESLDAKSALVAAAFAREEELIEVV